MKQEMSSMMSENRKHEYCQLQGGEIVYIVKDPGLKWRISHYECRQDVTTGNQPFVWLQGLPQDWKDLEFDTADGAEKFAQQQIRSGKAPANHTSTSK